MKSCFSQVFLHVHWHTYHSCSLNFTYTISPEKVKVIPVKYSHAILSLLPLQCLTPFGIKGQYSFLLFLFFFFNLSVIALLRQEGRVDWEKTWLSGNRKGGKSSQHAGYSTLSFTGSKSRSEMNSSSVLLLKGSAQMYKYVLVGQVIIFFHHKWTTYCIA